MAQIIGTVGIALLTLYGVLFSLLGYNMYFQDRLVEFLSRRANDEGMKPAEQLKGKRVYIEREERRAVRVNVYRSEGETLPAVYYCHGNGFDKGDADEDDDFCAAFAERYHVTLISIAYTKMPVHRTTYPQEEIMDAVLYTQQHPQEFGIVKDDYVMLGVGPGAYLAVLAAVMLVRRGVVPDGLILADPFVDYVAVSLAQINMHPGPVSLLVSAEYARKPKITEYADCLLNSSARVHTKRMLYTEKGIRELLRGKDLSEDEQFDQEEIHRWMGEILKETL
ncbi:MAG: alpha/beta hydrolase [Solobacterium sp.]|nr:alpha/beta hydrolase [Solobacterium sp.]